MSLIRRQKLSNLWTLQLSKEFWWGNEEKFAVLSFIHPDDYTRASVIPHVYSIVYKLQPIMARPTMTCKSCSTPDILVLIHVCINIKGAGVAIAVPKLRQENICTFLLLHSYLSQSKSTTLPPKKEKTKMVSHGAIHTFNLCSQPLC